MPRKSDSLTNKNAWGRIDWLRIIEPADYDQLIDLLDEEFAPREIAEKLKHNITRVAKFLVIEHDYVDKDYRSTYYHFYAKKGRAYRDDAVRLHFFDESVAFDDAHTDLTCDNPPLEWRYFGYIVVRPTIVSTLGRSLLSPTIRKGASGKAIQAQHHVHLLGHTLKVWGFPSMAQHTDISVCAHVACWAILRHYSERFSQHREFLIQDVTRLAAQFDPGGLTPALGLTVYEAERIFKAVDCFPLLVTKGEDDADGFYAQMLAYLESGFPLFVAMDGQSHAIVAAGFAWRTPAIGQPEGISHAWPQVANILAVDDNLLPYSSVEVETTTGSEADSSSYTTDEFESFIVPLPEKIYYAAETVELFALNGLYVSHKDTLGLPSEENLVRRYFVTTISALRRYARERQSEMGDELVRAIMLLRTAQFVWIVEYATHEQWANGHICARAIIDATASPHDEQPVWLSHNQEIAIVFDRSSARTTPNFLVLKRPANVPLGRMEHNLVPVRTR